MFQKVKNRYKKHSNKKENRSLLTIIGRRERGLKAPSRAQRAPQPSVGARRRGVESPEILVCNVLNISNVANLSIYPINPA